MKLDQMKALLERAHALPHKNAADAFMTAALMAETIECAAPTPLPRTAKRAKAGTILTGAKLRARGLDYHNVQDCAHALVDKEGLSVEAAAKKMGATRRQVIGALANWRASNPQPANGARS